MACTSRTRAKPSRTKYERDPADARTAHTLVLEVDPFGNALKSATIAYGRRRPDPALAPKDQSEQARPWIRYTENGFTNPIEPDDHFRVPLPSETRTFELTGLAREQWQPLRARSELVRAASTAGLSPYHLAPTEGISPETPGRTRPHTLSTQRSRCIPRRSAGTAAAGPIESLALPGERYKLAFTPELVAHLFGGRVDDDMLEQEGRYVHLDDSTDWWVPSGRTFFSPVRATIRLPSWRTLARTSSCHTGCAIHPPAGLSTESLVTFDDYDLLVVETRDALDNAMRAANDYRVLQPFMQTDPNGNRTKVAFDALGLVVGTAVMGKPDEGLGDTLDGFRARI